MKHKTAIMVTALAWTSAVPARAEQAPPPTTPAPPPAQPGTPPPAQTAPAPTPTPAPGAQTQPTPAPGTAPAPGTPTAPAPGTPTAPAPGAAPAAPAAGAAPAPTSPDAAAIAPATTPAATAAAPIEPLPRAQKAAKKDKTEPPRPLLGLAVATPDTGALPGRMRPSYGVPPKSASDYKFEFHGFMNVPFRMGINEREDPASTQYETVFHGPPVTVDELERFEHTGVIPLPWVQLGFSYGNDVAVANIIIAAESVSNAAGFFNPPTQLGINDAFLTFKPKFGRGTNVEFDVGAFANRYGSMGEYDTGRYDTPMIARVAGVGSTGRINVDLANDMVFLAELGFMGQWDRAPLGVEPAGWNDFAEPNVGTSFVHHEHIGLGFKKRGNIGLHYINAWTRDDRTAPTQPDGGLTVLGVDGQLKLAPFGRLFLGFGHTIADEARGVSGVVRVLNTQGGPGLMREYLGSRSGGTGTLSTFAAQYDVSIGEIVRNPQPFYGYAPDLLVSAFGMMTHVTSDDPGHIDPVTGAEVIYDGVDKLKYGAEATYSVLPWLAFGGRYDRVIADTSDDSKTLAAISPRVILRTDWNSQDQVTLQYSYWWYGSGVVAREGLRGIDDPSIEPDPHTISLTASMWW
jgi:hypothetical protein